MPAPLRQTFYVSRSIATPTQVEDILARARAQNATRQVTGALLFTGGHFAQVLEGPAPALADTMSAIAADGRHEALKILLDEALPTRRFGAWSMAYAEAPGADDLIAELIATGDVPAERAERLLGLMFKP
ncbi:MAG TPA: BLUF domain-containing protein [Rhizobacter sp.]